MAQSTKQIIKQAFLSLPEDNPFDKITVTDIVEKCNVNRNTFYYHFQDIYDLLDSIFAEEADNIVPHERLVDGKVSYLDWIQGGHRTLEYLEEHKKAIYHLYNSDCRSRAEDFFVHILYDDIYLMIKTYNNNEELDDDNLRILAKYHAHALTGIIFDWLKSGMNYDLTEDIDKINRFTFEAAKAALKLTE